MAELCTSCKPQHTAQDPCYPKLLKRRKPDEFPISQLPSAFWDNLSQIWLTKSALSELERRNQYIGRQNSLAARNWDHYTGIHTLEGYKAESLKNIARFARHGGPDISDLRGVRASILNPSTIIQCSYFPSTPNRSILSAIRSPP